MSEPSHYLADVRSGSAFKDHISHGLDETEALDVAGYPDRQAFSGIFFD
jgi:hypothetical protein